MQSRNDFMQLTKFESVVFSASELDIKGSERTKSQWEQNSEKRK